MNRSMRTVWIQLLLLFCPLTTAWGIPPTVLVNTAPLHKQFIADRLICYGKITPALSALKSISMPRAGQLVALRILPGERVKKGAVIFEFLTAPEGLASYMQAQNTLEYARQELQRALILEKEHLGTASQTAATQKVLDDARTVLKTQTTLQTNLTLQQVKAPCDGVVQSITATVGDRLGMGQNIVTLFQEEKLTVALGVEPEDLSNIRIGTKVELVSVFDPTIRFSSRITKITAMVNPQTRLIDVLVPIAPRHLLLQSGMQVRGDILIREGLFPVIVKSAVLSDLKGSFIFQINKNKAHKVAVHRLIESNGLIAISGSFDPTLPVVVNGNYELREGMSVKEVRP